LKAVGKLPVARHDLLMSALLVRPLLGLGALEEHLQLGLLVLQHPRLRADPCVKIQGGFLIACTRNGVD
jgi:hypothetical protein